VYQIFLALHLLAAIFAIGPLAHAVTTAARGLRSADAGATAASARTTRLYAVASLIVVVLGFALMSMKAPGSHQAAGQFGDLWIWLSLLLWLVAVALAMAVVVPTLDRATATIGRGEPVQALAGRVAASGGVIALLFVAIVFLMVFQPGA
jgi:hypothetical protein